MSGQLHTERRASTLLITLHHPEHRNALTPAMTSAAIEALNVAESDPAIRAVILTGAGSHFCAGLDLHRVWRARQSDTQALAREVQALHDWVVLLRSFPKPVIAAIEGQASGAGLALAWACDLLVVASDAALVASDVAHGLPDIGGASWQLARRVPRALAHEWLCLGTPVSARRLQELGLVNRVTQHGEALAQALELAAQLSRLPAHVLTSQKELLMHADSQDLAAHLDREQVHWLRDLQHPQAGQALRAAIEQRPPAASPEGNMPAARPSKPTSPRRAPGEPQP